MTSPSVIVKALNTYAHVSFDFFINMQEFLKFWVWAVRVRYSV